MQAREITIYQDTGHRVRLTLVRRSLASVPPVYVPVDTSGWSARMAIAVDEVTAPIVDSALGTGLHATDPGTFEWEVNLADEDPFIGGIAEFAIYYGVGPGMAAVCRLRARVNLLKAIVVVAP